MEDIELLLSYIETEINDGKKQWIGNGVTVDGESIRNLIERIRKSLPEATGEAVILDAKKKAQEIVDVAEQRRAALIEGSIAMNEAKARAEKIIVNAYQQKTKIEKDMTENLLAILSTLQNNLTEALKWVENAQKNVKSNLESKD